MMKKFPLYLALGGLVWFQSCKEVGPAIDFGPQGDDTTYTAATPEAPQEKKVLAEEFTGVSCPPCPKGHEKMRAINAQLNNRVVIIGYHKFDYPQSEPIGEPHKSTYDFRTQDASDVADNIFGGLTGMPYAAFDRVPVNDMVLLNLLGWTNAAADRAVKTTPVNIHITPAYDAATGEATIKVTLAYTENVDVRQNITVAITEDGIVDKQKDQNNMGELIIHDEYDHEHVLRDIITPIVGVQVPDKVNPKVPGRVYERTFKVTLKSEWKPGNCNVIAFVTNDAAGDRQVVHVEEVKLVP